MRCFLLLSLMVILISACKNKPENIPPPNGTAWEIGAFLSNGERIYFTAISSRGTPIQYSPFKMDNMSMMVQGKFSCATCHGPHAHGSVHSMGQHIMHAPDIRWKTLNDQTDIKTEINTGNKNEFTIKDFKNAVFYGKLPNGSTLSAAMPRWRMSDEDIKDLAMYLKTLP